LLQRHFHPPSRLRFTILQQLPSGALHNCLFSQTWSFAIECLRWFLAVATLALLIKSGDHKLRNTEEVVGMLVLVQL
jgi:hypothetical protein